MHLLRLVAGLEERPSDSRGRGPPRARVTASQNMAPSPSPLTNRSVASLVVIPVRAYAAPAPMVARRLRVLPPRPGRCARSANAARLPTAIASAAAPADTVVRSDAVTASATSPIVRANIPPTSRVWILEWFSPRWVLGGVAMMVAFGLHVGALALAPLTVVRPCLAAGLVILLSWRPSSTAQPCHGTPLALRGRSTPGACPHG